ncbi:MAG: hypothetical protein ABI792_08260 [bacterium]
MQIKKSLCTFTGKIIDYAGLFPPANLNLKNAFGNYLKYLDENYNFMLSKFICPVSLFPELKDLVSEVPSRDLKIIISALGRGGSDLNSFKKNLEEDLAIWNKFVSGLKENINVNSFEVKIPIEIISSCDSDNIALFLDSLSNNIKQQISQPVMIFVEGSSNDKWKENTVSLINGIEIHNQKNFDTGFKLRTGGTEANAFPSSHQIAFSIRKCLDRKVPMKFTAGLHHPFPHYDSEINAAMHGFVNVFASGIIAMRHDISDSVLEEVLNDKNPLNFIFTDDNFSWNNWKVEIADIEYARKDLVLSYGSCSFDEPVEDLKSLHLL